MAAETVPHRFFEQGRLRPDAPAYFERRSGVWRATSWSQYNAQVRAAGRGLIACGVERGGAVGILGFNRADWTVAHIATMSVGAVPVGIYTTSSDSEILYLLRHAELSVVVVDDPAAAKRIHAMRGEAPALRQIVLMSGASVPGGVDGLSWEEFLRSGESVPESRFEERLAEVKRGDLAVLIYTSGTTGPPKGVMLSHHHLVWTADVGNSMARVDASHCGLSYLPLSHILEQLFTIHGSASLGYSIYFAESLEKLRENLLEVQPRFFFGVPRVWEKMHAAMSARLATAPRRRQKIAAWAMRVGRSVNELRMKGSEPKGALLVQYRIAERLVYRRVKEAIGLGRAIRIGSGSAPIAREVLDFFAGFDLPIYEGYGLSETTGPLTLNQEHRAELGTVGTVIPGGESRIAEDGEILYRGPNVFAGYYRDPEATRAVLDPEGWFHTGDIGEFDSQGYLRITGRKKEILITSGGKNVAPAPIEHMVKQHPWIGEAVVIGDRRPYLTALVALDPEQVDAIAAAVGSRPSDVHESAAVRARVQEHVAAVNRELARVEQIKDFRILPRPLSIAENELTPTMKLKRPVIVARWSALLDEMYATS